MLQYLPTKLAEWIGENMQDELRFPEKKDPKKWSHLSVSELNNILRTHVVCVAVRQKWLLVASIRMP